MPGQSALRSAIDQPPLPAPSEKQRGVLRFSHPALRGWEWPFVAARGLEDGPAIALISGVHAGKYPPIAAIIRFMRELDPAHPRGNANTTILQAAEARRLARLGSLFDSFKGPRAFSEHSIFSRIFIA